MGKRTRNKLQSIKELLDEYDKLTKGDGGRRHGTRDAAFIGGVRRVLEGFEVEGLYD